MEPAPEPPLTPRPGPARWRAPATWRSLLVPASERTLVRRLAEGDPLDLARLTAQLLRERALVADAAAVQCEALARIVDGLGHGAPARAGDGGALRYGPTWLAREAEAALRAWLTGQDAGAVPSCDLTRAVARAFSERPLAERRAALAVCVERTPLEAHARASRLELARLGRGLGALAAALGRAAAAAPPCACCAAVPRALGEEAALLLALPTELAPHAGRALAVLRVLTASALRGPEALSPERVAEALAGLQRARAARVARAELARALALAWPGDARRTFAAPGALSGAFSGALSGVLPGALHGPGQARGPACGAECGAAGSGSLPERALAALVAAEAPRAREVAVALELELWRSRVAALDAEPRSIAARAAALARRAADARMASVAEAAASDAVAALLDAGDPAEALAVGAALGLDPAAARGELGALFAEALQAVGRGGAARRERRRARRAPRREGAANPPRRRDPRRAADFGAIALAVVAVGPNGPLLVHSDGPAATVELPQGDAPWTLVPGARARWWRALSCPNGELCGWVQLESAHDLQPHPLALSALVEAWRLAIEVAARDAAEPAARVAEGGPHRTLEVHGASQEVALAVQTAAADGLGALPGSAAWRCAWWRVEDALLRTTPVRLAVTREALGGATRAPGADADEQRLLRTLCEGEEHAELPGTAAFGFAVTAATGARHMVLVEPRARRARGVPARPERAVWLRALGELASEIELVVRKERAAAAGWGGLPWPVAGPASEVTLAQLARLARRGGGVALCGPPNSGRRTLARWLHLEFRARQATRCRAAADAGVGLVPVVLGAGQLAHGALPHGLLAPLPSGGARLVLGAERATTAEQLALAAALDAGEPAWVVLSAPPRALSAEGALLPELAARLVGGALTVTPLAAARERAPALFPAAYRAACDRLGVTPHAGFDPERGPDPGGSAERALAALFRADWPLGLADLAAVAEHAAGDPGFAADPAAALERVFGALDLAPVARLASRAPRRRDVAAALWCTRTAGGRHNQRRAALWLGWDPETLAARRIELELAAPGAVERALSG